MESSLSEQECKSLIDQYRKGNQEAGDKVFQSYLKAIENVASNRINKSNYDYAMLFRIGKDGLWDAIKNYDLLNGNFRSFAITCISNKIDNFLKNNPIPTFGSLNNGVINNIINDLHLNVEKRELLEFRYTLEKLPKSVKTFLILKYEKKLLDEEIITSLKTNEEALNKTYDKLSNMLKVQFGVTNIKMEESLETSAVKDKTDLIKSKETINEKKLKQNVIKKSLDQQEHTYFILNYLPSNDLAFIKSIIELDLTDKQKEVIYKKFGLKLDENNNLNSAMERGILEITLEKVSRIISEKEGIVITNNDVKEKKTLKDIYSQFPGKNLKEIMDIINIAKLTSEEKRILYKKYGSNLQEVNSLSSEELNTFNRMMRRLREIDLSISYGMEQLLSDDLDKISSEIRKTLFKYDKNELIIFILRLHLTFNDTYDINDLCDYFNMSEEEINIITKKLLTSLNADFSKINRLMRFLFNSESKILIKVKEKK